MDLRVRQCILELGHAINEDISGFTGKIIQYQLYSLIDLACRKVTMDEFRNNCGLCPYGKGHWYCYCDDNCPKDDSSSESEEENNNNNSNQNNPNNPNNPNNLNNLNNPINPNNPNNPNNLNNLNNLNNPINENTTVSENNP